MACEADTVQFEMSAPYMDLQKIKELCKLSFGL